MTKGTGHPESGWKAQKKDRDLKREYKERRTSQKEREKKREVCCFDHPLLKVQKLSPEQVFENHPDHKEGEKGSKGKKNV